MKDIRALLLMVILSCPAQAIIMTAGQTQISRTVLASAGQPATLTGTVSLAQTVGPPPGSYLPGSLFLSHALANNFYAKNGQIHMVFPSNAVPRDFYLRISDDLLFPAAGFDPSDIQTANQKAIAQGGPYRQPIHNGIIEVIAYDTGGNSITDSLNGPVTLNLAVENTLNGGTIVGTTPELRLSALSLWVLDTNKKMWRNLSDPAVDTQGKRVSAVVQNFGVYAAMGGQDTLLDQVIAYPIPWRPHSGNPLTGTEASGITFDLLPSECTIQIFTVSGQLVKEIAHSGGSSLEKWDVRNSEGEPVASGLYLYSVITGSGHKTGKLIVIR